MMHVSSLVPAFSRLYDRSLSHSISHDSECLCAEVERKLEGLSRGCHNGGSGRKLLLHCHRDGAVPLHEADSDHLGLHTVDSCSKWALLLHSTTS